MMRSPQISPGRAFGGLPVPPTVEILNIEAAVGTLTAMRTKVPERLRGLHPEVALFIPGFTGSKEDFYAVFDRLARGGWQAWSYSQRGQADSHAPGGASAYTVQSGANDAIEVAGIIARATGRPSVNLVGHSYGGLIAQAAVIAACGKNIGVGQRSTGIFRSVALMCSGPHGWPGRHADIERQLATDSRDLWSQSHPTITPDDLDRLSAAERFSRARAMATSRQELREVIHQLGSVHDVSFALRDTRVPVLVFHGSDDFAWPQEWQRREARIVGARYEVIADAGHSPNVDQPAATADLLADFWTNIDQ